MFKFILCVIFIFPNVACASERDNTVRRTEIENICVSVDKLLKDYDNNILYADRQYKNKAICIIGNIEEIRDGGCGFFDVIGDTSIKLCKAHDESFDICYGTIGGVCASFNGEDNRQKLINLNKGQKIMPRCVVLGRLGGVVVVKDCEFFSSQEKR